MIFSLATRLADEFFGTAIMIILGNGSVADVELKGTKGTKSGWITISVGYGFAVMIPALMFGPVSGNHINPAFTLGLAFAIAWTGLYVPIMRSGAVFAITIAEFILVIALSSRVQHMAPATATLLFFLYAVMNGVMFSVYFIAYNLPLLIGAFLVAAIYFGVMAAYGAITKKDLSSWGAIGLSGLIALLIFEIICMFLNIGNTLLCVVGLVLFMCITAYDTQKIKAYYYSFCNDSAMLEKAGILAALSLYLDFINIFLRALRLFARNRSNN